MNAKGKPEFRYATSIRRAHDPWTHSFSGAGWSHVFEQLSPGPFEALAHEAWLGPIQLAYEYIGAGFSYRGHSWPGSRVFLSYFSDTACRYYDCRPVAGGMVVSHRWDAVERVVSPCPIRLAIVAIDEAFVTEQFNQLLGCSSTPALAAMTSTSDPQRVRLFKTCVMDVLFELEQRPQLIDVPNARAEFRARIMDMLVEVMSVSTGAPRRLPPPTTRAYVVRRAAEIMEGRKADAISVTDLCREIGVCPRTLRYSFEEVTGVSPTQYLLSVRLNGVWRELSHRANRSPVQVVAARWGFWHMSRFARYYRLTFGERPSDTVAAANGRKRCQSSTRILPSRSQLVVP
jgi:AraC family ethanolamine operon transcriptional activator